MDELEWKWDDVDLEKGSSNRLIKQARDLLKQLKG